MQEFVRWEILQNAFYKKMRIASKNCTVYVSPNIHAPFKSSCLVTAVK